MQIAISAFCEPLRFDAHLQLFPSDSNSVVKVRICAKDCALECICVRTRIHAVNSSLALRTGKFVVGTKCFEPPLQISTTLQPREYVCLREGAGGAMQKISIEMHILQNYVTVQTLQSVVDCILS